MDTPVSDAGGGFVHADASFRIGTAHEGDGSPCQDYALSGQDPVAPIAILSDGCSQSGRTDVGARILALVARRVFGLIGPEARAADFRSALRPAVLRAASELGIGFEDLDATLAAVAALPGGGARALMFGDGVISARSLGGVDTWTVDWAGNMPGYPGYLWDRDRMHVFIAESEAAGVREGRAPFVAERRLILPDGNVTVTGREERGAADGLLGLDVSWEPGPDAPDVVSVFSDGVFQVSGILWHEVVSELAAVRASRNGSFVTRRMARALSGFAKRGGRPADDISMAAIAAEATRQG